MCSEWGEVCHLYQYWSPGVPSGQAGWSNVTYPVSPCSSHMSLLSAGTTHWDLESHQKHLVGGAGGGGNLHLISYTASLTGQNSRFYIPSDRTMQRL